MNLQSGSQHINHGQRQRTTSRTEIGLHHLAFYRAFFEHTLNLANIADKYLETGRNLIDARQTLIWVQDALLVVGARKGKAPEQLALLTLPASVRKSVTEAQEMLDRLRAVKRLAAQADTQQTQSEASAGQGGVITFDDFIATIAPKIGCVPQTLNDWARNHEVDTGTRDGVTSAERERVKELEREVKELRRANEILKLASAFFA